MSIDCSSDDCTASNSQGNRLERRISIEIGEILIIEFIAFRLYD